MIAAACLCATLVVQQGGARARDTVRIKADGKPAWGENVGLVEQFSIGQLNGPPEYAFGKIEYVAVAPDGAFYTFDSQDRQIRHFDAKGNYLNAIGRKGGGPSEYREVTAMAVTHDLLLIVYDPHALRITYFRPDGKVHHEFQVPRNGFAAGFIIDNAGRIYLQAASPGAPSEGPQSHQQLLRFREQHLLDSLSLPARDAVLVGAMGIQTTDGLRGDFFDRGYDTPYSGGGLLAARSGAYRFLIDTGGPSVRLIERSTKPVPLGSAERDEWIAIGEYYARVRQLGSPLPVPHAKPFIRGITSDDHERIWVEVYAVAERRTNVPGRRPGGAPRLTWIERTTFDVFSPIGAYLGQVTLPPESILMAVRDDHLWVRTKGTDGEDRITVFRLERGGR